MSWPNTTRVFQRVHVDFLQKFNRYFFILVDSYTRWIEVEPVSSTNAEQTVRVLRKVFSIFGLPEEIVSDNGSPFNSEVYHNFGRNNGIKITLIPPVHPNSNGTIEKQVDTVKKALIKQFHQSEQSKTKFDLNQVLCDFLLKSHITPNSVTKKSPAELIFRQIPRTKLQLLKPISLREKCNSKLPSQEARKRNFVEWQKVLVLNKRRGEDYMRWIPGKILKRISISSYLVGVKDEVRFLHIDFIKHNGLSKEHIEEDSREEVETTEMREKELRLNFSSRKELVNPENRNNLSCNDEELDNSDESLKEENQTLNENNSCVSPKPNSQYLRRSSRIIKAPERLNM